MNNNRVIIGLISFVVIACFCPVCCSIVLFSLETIGSDTLQETFASLALAALCIVPIGLALIGGGWKIAHIFRSKGAGGRLAQAMGLIPLNQTTKQMEIWYGGQHNQRDFAIRPYGLTYRYYAAERSRTGVKFYLQIIVEVKVPQPLDVMVKRGVQKASKNPQNFEEAFETTNAGKLTGQARAAMFDFVQKGYKTGLTGSTLRFSKGRRNLQLYDRASAKVGALAPEVLPDAHVVLIHDHPETTISADTVRSLLDDMVVVAKAIEASA